MRPSRSEVQPSEACAGTRVSRGAGPGCANMPHENATKVQRMKRRDLIALVGSAAVAAPLAARAQQRATPVIGYLSGGAADYYAPYVAAFRQGLRETGYVEGQNVAIEYLWAEGGYDRLPGFAAEFAARNVDVIVASGSDLAARAAKRATSTIPVVFNNGGDPVAAGLVSSL